MYEPGKAAADCLDAPAVGIMDVAGAPEDARRNNPSPNQLPEDGWPPINDQLMVADVAG